MALKYSVFSNAIIENGIAMGRPVSGFFELTARCNLRCKMCYVCGMEDHQSLMAKELTTAQWIEMGKQARDAGVLFLTLTGGEILIRKDFVQIYEAFTQMGFIITLFTNGTLLNDEIIRCLVSSPPSKVSITIYGANAATYGNVTGHPEAYDKVVANIRKLVDTGIEIQLKTTVIKYNRDDFNEIAKLTKSFGRAIGLVNYISPRREGSGTDPLANRLEPLDLVNYEFQARQFVKLLNADSTEKETTDIVVDDVMSDERIDSVVSAADKSKVKNTAFRCVAGRCGFWVSWEGKMFPCGLLTEIQADAVLLGFEGAWSNLQTKCADVPSCQECESCSYYSHCMTCPARLKLETGAYTKAAPYLCEYVKAQDAARASERAFT